jgi:hypothetical protein
MYTGAVVGEGSGLDVGDSIEPPWVGMVPAGLVAIAVIPDVGLGGTVGLIPAVAVSVEPIVLTLGEQPASAAPAAAVAASLMNVRRDMGCPRFMGHLLIRYRLRITNNNHAVCIINGILPPNEY